MNSPDDRARPSVKEWIGAHGRSRSASNFKNSPYYEKFLFFESQRRDQEVAGKPGVGAARSGAVSRGVSSKYGDPHPSGHRRAIRVRSQPLTTEHHAPQSVTREREGLHKVRGSHVRFSYGKTPSLSPPSIQTGAATSVSVSQGASSKSGDTHLSGHKEATHSHFVQKSQGKEGAYHLLQGVWSVTATTRQPAQLQLTSHFVGDADRSIQYRQPTQDFTGSTVPRYSSALFREQNKHSHARLHDDLTTTSVYTSVTSATTRHSSNSKTSTPVNQPTLFQLTSDNRPVESRRCLSTSDISSMPLHVEISSSLSHGNTDWDYGLSAYDSHSEVSSEVFSSRSPSLGALSDCQSTVLSSPQREHRAPCTSPLSEPIRLLPTEVTMPEPIRTLPRQTSKASINLSTSGHRHMSKSDTQERKIRVIKANRAKAKISLESCTRLDEWLSTVMKLQRERTHTDDWAFPDDGLSASACAARLDPSQTLQTHLPKGQSRSLDLPSAKDDEPTQPRRWSSTGMNTDISFLPEHTFPRASRNPPFVTRYRDEQRLSKSIHSGNASSFSFAVRSDQYSPDALNNDIPQSGSFLSSELQSVHQLQETDANAQVSVLSISSCSPKRQSPPKAKTESKTGFSNLTLDDMQSQVTPSRSFTDMRGFGITICVTGEDDPSTETPQAMRHYLDRSTRMSGAWNTENEMFNVDNPPIARGATPHYMFPSNRAACDDDLMMRLPLSPRNSIGSISSVHSYKSSNADSAVDLGPLDDDQDLEYADFLDKYQARRLSSLGENMKGAEKEMKSVGSSTEPLEAPSILDITSSFADSPTLGLPQNFFVPLQKHVTGLPHLVSHNVTQQAPRPPLSDPSSRHASIGGSELDVETLETVAEYTSRIIRRHSLNDDLHSSTSRERLLSALENLGSQWSSFRPYSRIVSDSKSAPHVHLVEPSETARMKTKPLIIPKTAVLSESDVQKTSLDQSLSVHHHQSHHHHYHQGQLEQQQQQQQQQQGQQHVIPEFVISDHSDISEEVRNISMHSEAMASDADIEVESLLSSPVPSSGLSSPVLLEVGGARHRSGSVSSISSEASTCSTCTIMSESDPERKPRKKQSSWRKIRSFILWSPFIQVFKKHRYPWIQLAGHQGNFHAGEAGSVLKKLDSREQACFKKIMSDKLKDYVPEYRGDVDKNGDTYIQLQDLLCSFSQPNVMDVKMGVRTYLEDELQKARRSPTLRKDMYQKMIEVDSTAPTTDEHEQKAVTKPRYMQWRDEMSSSVELGFRVEGIKKSDGNSSKDFKKTKTKENIVDIVKSFVGDNENIVAKYIRRLKDVMQTQETSEFFRSHEVIGSSLLFVHDTQENVGVWMIDFGKTEPLPSSVSIDHRTPWNEGNHEDGYLFGLDNLISIFEEVQNTLTSTAV